MKHNIIIFFTLISFHLFAQDEKNQVLKINLSGIALKTFGIQYEKILGKRISLNLGANYRPKELVPFVNSFTKLTQLADERVDYISLERVKKEETEVGLLSFTPEIRLYLSKKNAPIGTYLGFFGKLNYYQVVTEMQIESKSLNVLLSIPMDTKLKTYTGGLVLGKQFQIGNRFTLDWYILGGHFGKISTSGIAKIDQNGSDNDFRVRLKNKIIETYQINTDILSVEVDNQGVSVENIKDLKYFNLRGFGFNLGFRF